MSIVDKRLPFGVGIFDVEHCVDLITETVRIRNPRTIIGTHRITLSIINMIFSSFVFFRKEEEIEKLRSTAEKAINVSSDAFEITKDAVNQQKNIRYNYI